MPYKIKDLPKAIQDAIYSIDVEDSVITIGQRNGLHLDQVADLHDLVSLVFLGDVKPQNFSREVAKQIGILQEKADIITAEINAQIFQPVHDELMQVQSEGVEDSVQGVEETNSLNPKPSTLNATLELHAALNEGVADSVQGIEKTKTDSVTAVPSTLTPVQDIHESKLTAPTQTAQKEVSIDHRTSNTLIPEDHKERINKDPYKESIS